MRKKLMGLIGASVLGVSVMFPLSGKLHLVTEPFQKE